MSFARDLSTNAIVNHDDSYYRTIKAEREANKRSSHLEEELKSLKDEFIFIRNQLAEFMGSRN